MGTVETPNLLAAPSATMAEALRARAADSGERVYLRFEDRRWTFAETYTAACRYANLFLRRRDPGRPFHVGVLMDNVPTFLFAEFGCAVAGAALVGLNPTRTDTALARDVVYADCQLVIVEPRHLEPLRHALTTKPTAEVQVLVAQEWSDPVAQLPPGWRLLEDDLATVPDKDPEVAVDAGDQLMIIFTSGTTKAPKGVLNSNGRLMMLGWGAANRMCGFTSADVVYSAMPLYHANAQILAVAASLSAGGGIALARRFSKSHFLSDVRRHGATLFNYVGSPLAYIMDTPARADDADNPLRLAYGNEAPRQFIDAFQQRFKCPVVDGYGASEVGVGFSREPGDPPRSLGRAEGVKILDENGAECAVAQFDDSDRLLNADAAIGEIVNTAGAFLFEGYYKDEESTRERTRKGWFHTGDLGYRDAQGFIYFAGRDAEWLRVGGENFLARPIEEILGRCPDVMLAAVYGVPDPEAGDQVMAAVTLRSGAKFSPEKFGAFVDGATDLPPRWRPTFVRVVRELTVSHSHKVLKRALQREKFLVDRIPDLVYWRPRGTTQFRLFTAEDLELLRERFVRAGQANRLEE